MSPDVNAPVMGPFERSHQHGPPLLGRVRGPTRSPTSSLVCSPPTPALPSAAAPVVPGRWPTLSLVRQGGRRASPGAWAVLFQRAVGADPAGCASRLAHRVETAIAFRLHNALGTQNERYFVAVNPTAHSLACLRIGVFVTADAARLATGVGGSPFTGRVSHPLDGKQSFMTSPHRHSPLTSLAWSHRAPTPRNDRVVRVERRRRIGTAGRLKAALWESEDSETLNTSFVERLNLTIRQGSAYLRRRSPCHARGADQLHGHVDLLRCSYNFIRPHPRFGPVRGPSRIQSCQTSRRDTAYDDSNRGAP